MKISYVIGTNSYTKEVNLTSNESLEIMNKQLSLSIPLITGAKIKRKKRVKQIFVGKELSLSSLHKNNFWLQKYDLSLEEVMDIPSEIMINIQGEEIRLVADPESIEKNFKGMEGKKFQITYEKVYGFVGDGCDEYLRFVSAKNIN